MKKLFQKQSQLPLFSKTIKSYKIILNTLLLGFLLISQYAGILYGQCGTDHLHQHMLAIDPEYKLNMEKMEKEISAMIQKREKNGTRSAEIYTIPIVVHVIHLDEPIGTGTNISDSWIHEAIRGLNERWRNLVGVGVDMQIEFCLAKRDTNNLATNGINRVNGAHIPNYKNNGIDVPGECTNGADEKKIKDLSIWPVSDYYNIWIVNKTCSNSIGGYAKFPFMSQETDGAVIAYSQFTYGYYLTAHELAHGFNLFHTFQGDEEPPNPFKKCPINNNCEGEGDRVCDTPPHKEKDCGNVNPCSSLGNWNNSQFNYLSYCQPKVAEGKFTQGQKDRVYFSILASRRRSLLFSQACKPPLSLDVSVTKIESPLPVVDIQNCPGSDSITPRITIKNLGHKTIQSFNIKYKINENIYQNFIWADGNLIPGKEINISLKKVQIIQGNNSLTVYTTLPNGSMDEFNKNDTLVYNFKVNFSSIFQSNLLVGDETCAGSNDGFLIISNQPQTEIMEDFETSSDWIIENRDQINRWIIGNEISSNGTNSIYISDDNKNNTYTPNIQSIVNFYKDFDFPSDVINISLEFDWKCQGVNSSSSIGALFVFVFPLNFPLPNEFNINDYINNSNYRVGLYIKNETFQTANLNLPKSLIGKRNRIVFTWLNRGAGNQPPASVDNISVIYERHPKLPYSTSLNEIIQPNKDTIIGLGLGEYSLVVTNGIGCTFEKEIKISHPEIINVEVEKVNSNCFNSNNGEITLNVEGGTPPYNFIWNNGSTLSNLDMLRVGEYNVNVSDYADLMNKVPINSCVPDSKEPREFGMGIYNVEFNTINNSSIDILDKYKDFTSISTTVEKNQTYKLTIKTGTGYREKVRAWIDFNNDGIFENDEIILQNINTNPITLHEANIKIPLTVTVYKPLRMRIGTDYYSNLFPQSCSSEGSVRYGQYQDYTIIVGSPCTIEKSINIDFLHPILLIEESKCNEQNCELISGEIKLQDSQCSDLQKVEFQVNDGLWQDVIPAYDNENSKKIAARYKIEDQMPHFSEVGYYLTNPSKCPSICNCPDLHQQSKVVEIANSICIECNYTTGKIMLPSETICPDGSSFQVSIDMGVSWLNFIPDYDNFRSMKLITRCSCDEDSTKTSPWSEIATTEPSFCPPECNCANLTPNIIGTDTICHGQSTSLSASGGVSYIWSNQERTNSIFVSPVVTTTYTVTVTDVEGCSASNNIRVTVNPNPVPVITGTDNICYNTATMLDAGQGYVYYNWSDGGGTGWLSTFNELKSDKTITVTVTDANQCQGTGSIDLKVRPQVIPGINGHENLCGGDEMILYTTLPFAQYFWSNNGGSQSEAVYSDVAPEEQYSVTVTDMFGCSGIATVSIDAFTGLNVVLSTENTSCGLDNGSAKASIAAQGNYTFLWATQQTGDHITGLSAGMYTVTVTDDKACSGIAIAIIDPSNVITLNPEVAHTTCGLSNGSAHIIAEGGTGFRYLWNNGNVSSFRENLAPGSYTVTVTAMGDCTAVSEVFIEDSQGLTLSAEVDHTTCGESNGSITVAATGGESYDYQWNTGDFGPMLIRLPEGDYSVTVTDQRTCFSVLEKTILPSLPLQVEINGPDAVCEGGTATVSVPEGLSYEWNTGATGSTLQVSPGEYSVTVTDLTGCSTLASKSIQTLVVPAPDILGPDGACKNKTVTLSIQDGDNIVWSSGQNTQNIEVLPGTYSVTVTDLNGCSSVASKTVNVLSESVVTINGVNEVCTGNLLLITATGGVNYSWSTGENTAHILVPKGSYTVTVTNNNGCTATNEKIINNYINPIVTIVGANSVCGGNTTTITASGGLSYKWSNGPNTAINSVTSGSYTVTATDINGCTATSQKTINSLMGPTINIAGITNICFGDVTTLTVSGGISYVWNTGINTPSINVGIGTYTVTVSDINGCTSSKNVDIQLSTLPSIQTKDISFSAISKNQITLKWVNGNGKGRIVVAKANSPVLGTPLDGITYNGDTSFGIGAQLSLGEFIVYNGTGTSLTVTNLIENNTYHFRIFEYGCSKNYLTTIANGNPANQIAKCLSPTNQSTTISFFLVSTNQFTANWTNGNGNRRVVKINTVNNFSPPANGTDPLANSKYVGYGEQVVYNGTGSSVTITGLMPNMTYWVRIYEANCSGSSSFYNTSPGTNNPISQRTRTVLPSVQSFAAANVIFNGNTIVDISPIFFTNQPYATHPPIDIFLEENNKTRFTLNATSAEGFSFQLVDQLTIVTDGTMAISPQTYGELSPVISTSVNSMYMDYIHPENVNISPYLSLKIRLLFEGGLVGMSIPVHIHAAQGALPVEFLEFRAQYNKKADINELSWITKSEVNNDYFDIERSFESFTFENIGRVTGSGNSTTTIDYVFNDKNIQKDGNYTYRLRQVDLNGKENFSKPASVKVSRFQSIKTGLFPNPASDLINCFVDAYEGAIVNIDIFNSLGQKVSRNVNPEIIGSMGLIRQIDSKDFGKGIFNVVFNIDGISYNHKLIIID